MSELPGFKSVDKSLMEDEAVRGRLHIEGIKLYFYRAGIEQGKREQAEKIEKCNRKLYEILNPPAGEHQLARERFANDLSADAISKASEG